GSRSACELEEGENLPTMGVITLNAVSSERGVKKSMQFDPSMLVFDACKLIREKLGLSDTNPAEYGLFRVEDDPTRCVWMENGKALEHYLLRNQDSIEYRRKMRVLRVRMLDNAVKSVPVDESKPVKELMLTVCAKIGIANYEEYSLVRESPMQNGRSTADLRSTERVKTMDGYGGRGEKSTPLGGTLGRRKEKNMEQLRQKLQTDDDLNWVDQGKTLREQGIGEEETLLLRRKYFFSDTNVDSRDPVQLNLLYVQCRDEVLRGKHPVTKETALQLGALQCQVLYGDFPENKPKFIIEGRDVLPKEYAKSKETDKVIQMYRELIGTGDLDAKSKYVHLCKGLNTYGVTFFLVKEKLKGKNKLVPRLLGVNKESVMRVDEKTKEVMKEWPLEQVRKWAPTPRSFTLDFGDYADGFYTVQTADGEKIAQLIGGYIDIILKKKKIRDHLGIEGDEGSTMLEDMVAPARATLVSHGTIGGGQHARDGHVALPGVLRSATNTPHGYGINGAQYGAVSGQIINQHVSRSQRAHIQDPKERAQRALIGTIEATIRAVEQAEEEMEKEPHIELPKFPDDPASRRIMDDQIEVGKERVNERLAAMGAATAQVVQWTAVKEEYDDRVGTAVATIGSNMPEVGRDVRDLAALMPEQRRGDLVDATRKLCGAFGDFLTAVNPEHDENRTTVLAAASRVGDYSRNVITTIEEETTIQTTFTDGLMQKAKDVASSTAQLVQRAKTISTACQEPEHTERVIQSATRTAFATSQLVACTRVVAPTIDSDACQQQLTSAAKEVARSVEQLLHDAQGACQHDSNVEQARRNLGDIHDAARLVTNALDGLLGHIRTNPKLTTETNQYSDEYERLLRSSNQLITHQGPSQELVRHGERVIRHSQILVEEFEREAEEKPENRQRLLDAARRVADATSNMIDATKEVESRPGATESQMALRSAAERLQTETSAVTTDQQSERTMHQLEQAAKQVAYNATQTIAAASACKQLIESHTVVESLIMESSKTGDTMPRLISSIRESQNAQTASDKFRAQSRLIRDSHVVMEPSLRLVDVARSAVVHVPEPHMAANLQQSSQQLSESLSEMRVALNHAQQLNFSQQLVYSEELIKELDQELLEVQRAAIAGRLQPLHAHETGRTASSALTGAVREVGSTLAQLVSAAMLHDIQHIGASAVDAAQSLRTFTAASRSVCATRKDVQLDSFIVSARSVVHDAGGIFDRVREDASAAQFSEAAKLLSTSLRKCVACIPQHQHIEQAINQIRTISASSTVREPDIRRAASSLAAASSDLVVAVRAPQHHESVNVFVNSYTDFHTSVMAALPAVRDREGRIESLEYLEAAREQAVEVLSRAAVVASDRIDRPDPAHLQTLTTTTKQLTETVNLIVEKVVEVQRPWETECDAALRQIQSVRHLVDQASLPVNDDSYFGSLDKVTAHSRSLGEAMTGIAKNAKQMETGGHEETTRFCHSVRQSADAVCSLAEAAAQSAYLVGVAHPKSVRGESALVDAPRLHRSAVLVVQACDRIEKNRGDRTAVLEDLNDMAKHTSLMASLCREASDRTTAVTIKKQFINEAAQLASKTSNLFKSANAVDERPNSVDSFTACASSARELRETVQSLVQFVERPDFAPRPAAISHEGKQAQIPVMSATRRMLDASAQMIGTSKDLAAAPRDATTWQHIASNSRDVSESIKSLVAAIRDAAPGQMELDSTISKLEQLIQHVERREMDAVGSQPRTTVSSEKVVHQQIVHGTQSLFEKVDGLRTAACSKGEELAQRVEEQWSITQPLVNAVCEAAESSTDSRTQTALFEQTKTVVEAELELMRSAKEAGGNAQARDAHVRVEESSALYKEALGELNSFVNRMSSEKGVTHGMVETITRSIAFTDGAMGGSGSDAARSVADAHTNMSMYLEEIRRTAENLPPSAVEDLPARSLHLSETYKKLSVESHNAILLSSPEQAQRLKVAVQRLGSACIDCVKKVGTRTAHPRDSMAHRDMNEASMEVIERVRDVLAALHHGSKGTQACINAANTVSGIIGDLDTTILFATSGSLHAGATHPGEFTTHREEVIKTAKALIEDTKALVAGAASNQEQLAVAAQNAVRTMVILTEVVKTGALSLTGDHNMEAQVSVMHACRDVAATLSALINATKNASGKSLKDPAIEHMKDATRKMIKNVTSLLKLVKSVEDREQKGTLALEAAEEAIAQEISKFEHDAGEGTSSMANEAPVTTEQFMKATHGVSGAASKLAGVGSSLSQEDAVAAANLARTAVSELLRTTRVAAYETETAEAKYTTINAGREVALQVRNLMRSVHGVLRVSGSDPRVTDVLVDTTRALARALKDLTACSELIKNEMAHELHDPLEIAESELIGAAVAIDAAAVKLAELRPRETQQRINENMTFDETILSAAKSITTAVATLVKAASDAQRELVAQGRDLSHRNGGKVSQEYQWSEGLISAAKFVAAAVQQLCDAANSLVQGQASEEKLIVAAKQVASSTAQLLIACNVRADQGSQANRRLQAAGAAVKSATERLVGAARQSVVEDERTIVISERLVSGIAQVMTAKEAVLRKEKELQEARANLATINKERYDRGISPEE
ncbi:hypothetical protein PFISCL1PPCAC_19357, partial [Pristionchus fissidentatus]